MKRLVQFTGYVDNVHTPPGGEPRIVWLSIEGDEVDALMYGRDGGQPEDSNLSRDFSYVFDIAPTIFEEIDDYDGEVEFHKISFGGYFSEEEPFEDFVELENFVKDAENVLDLIQEG